MRDKKRKKIRKYFKRTKPPGFFLRLFGIGTNPTDDDIDRWFGEDIIKIVKDSYGELNLVQEHQVREPMPLFSPILWEEARGVNSKDLRWRKGRDDIVRFAINRMTVIHFTNTGIISYGCDFNFTKNVTLNESTEEFHYNDIVAITTKEISTSYTLPNNTKLVHAQAFRIAVPSGDAIEFVISAEALKDLTGGKIPTTDCEKARGVLREMVRERKLNFQRV